MTRVVSPARQPGVESLLGKLVAKPQDFDLNTAIRIAEASGRRVEIISDASTVLASAAITSVEDDGTEMRIKVTITGIVGAFGALPPAYTLTVLEEERRRSNSMRSFLDLFAAPLFGLMLDAREKYRLPSLLQWKKLGRANRIAGAILSLAGFRFEPVRAANPVGDATVLRYAGLFAARNRNANALGAMLADFIGLPVAVEQFSPRWIEVAHHERTSLGPGSQARLGVDAMAGFAVQDYAGGFRIVIGPVGYADFLSFEPGTPRLATVMELARLYAGPALRFDVQIVLRKEDVPFCRLDSVRQPRLGWNSWARAAPATMDSRDAVVRMSA